ncbi:hypothetical protein FRAAL4825 [Frankia alni ACN14a]|uniref:Uncharacterized protein n=1 Tax=Frankia alni (strain DSM 45986 / CECT 9034 / ACN14a) TaxID=326424 RepID=Q0RGC2_FRAAA|nr:hypothetical protein FRAAL4825 [Frankia alni ACN14a]
MDTVEFRIESAAFPTGPDTAVEPWVNGVRVRDLARTIERPFAEAKGHRIGRAPTRVWAPTATCVGQAGTSSANRGSRGSATAIPSCSAVAAENQVAGR